MSGLRDGIELGPEAAAGLRFALVVSAYHEDVTGSLAAGAEAALREHGAAVSDICTVTVPGAFELPMASHRIAVAGGMDAVVCLGVLIRGETAHFDVLSASVAGAVQAAARETGVPVTFGVLTCDNLEQARARAGGELGNKGTEAAVAAIEMALLYRRLERG